VSLSTAALKPVAVIFALGLSAQRDPTPKAEATFNGTVITRGGLLHTEVFAIVRFDAKPSSDLDGKIVGYTWNFGDGMTGTGAHVEHKYSNAGKFCPLLTVTDDSGQIGYAAGRILVGTNDPGDCV
jgi:chitodextrinase